ncbi:MAG: molybdopterin molybdotransferase MoeA [Candidatus Thermoplasmatota archaeon]|nr:molybdopterin molybdotransferase MoeA [Candidatus Thermoplasmatota archaeon]
METFVTIERAIDITLQSPIPHSIEWVQLGHAHNRILAQDLISKVNDPPFDNSAMDGWAVRSDDDSRVEIGVTAAGDTPSEIKEGEAIRIMTGAPIPKGADAIVMIEDGIDGYAHTNFIRRCGENLVEGDTILHTGQRMTPSSISLAATMGYESIPVRTKPRVAVISTGNELVPPGEDLKEGQIYESNSYGLCALLEKIGCEPILHGVVEDTIEGLRSTLDSIDCDVILTSGGVSMGDFDFVRKLMEDEGTIHFWKVAMRPGGPPLFGDWKGKPLFGLPGNPVSSHLVFMMIVAPWLAPQIPLANKVRVRMKDNVKGAPGKVCLRRISISSEGDQMVATTHTHQGSGNIHSMTVHNGLTLLPPDTDASIGDTIDALLLH